jgi:uncharacterized protein with PIN domain
MTEATLWFDPGLLDLVKSKATSHPFAMSWFGRRSVKDLIESVGIPHVEVDLILVNREPVDFAYIVLPGDKLEVYGDSRNSGRSDCTGLKFIFPGEPRFVCDVHLGKLTRRLRLLGFDVDYRSQRGDRHLAWISDRESRYLLTRDLHLLMRRAVHGGVLIRSHQVDHQLTQVWQRFDLQLHCKPFSRCLSCNGMLKPLHFSSKEENQYQERIPAAVKQWCRDFKVCAACDKVYWPGTHYQRLEACIQKIYPRWPISPSGEASGTKE